MHPSRNVRFVLPAVLTSVLAAQNPRLAEVGEPIPDGFGQLVGSADFEGDGDIDLFSTTGCFLNEGGHFVAGPRYDAAFNPGFNIGSMEFEDFDGDGFVDVLVARTGGSPAGLVMMKVTAATDPSFVISPAVPNGTLLSEMAVADVDLDGDVDIIAASFQSSVDWQLLLNDGAGNFTVASPAQWSVGPPLQHFWVGTGDFNGDGFPDVFANTSAGVVYRNNLSGAGFSSTLVAPPTFASSLGCIGDFNGDGFDDVVLGNSLGDEALYLGSFNGLVLSNSGTGPIFSAPPIAVDRDGDGFDDLVRNVAPVGGAPVAELFVYPGQASGLGTPVSLGEIRYTFTSSTPYPGVAVFDVEGDGDLDTVVASGGMSPYILLQDANGGHALAEKIMPPQLDRLYLPPRDVDGDGDVDLVTYSFVAGQTQLDLWRNDGRGDFGAAPVTAGSLSVAVSFAPRWSDLDGDGDLDIWINSSNAAIPATIALNDGTGQFTQATTVNNLGAVTAQVTADFTGDGILDVVVGQPLSGIFPPIVNPPLLLSGQSAPGSVSYAFPAPFGVAADIADLLVVDPDQDGDPDLLVAARATFLAPGSVFLLENDGSGGFTALPPLPGVQATTLAAGDLDLDGIEDVVIGEQTWLGNGTTYVAQGSHMMPVGQIGLADLDEDGILDLFDQAGAWYPGDGQGNFGMPIAFVPYAPEFSRSGGGRTPVDLDGDGDLDAIGPSASGEGHLTIYANLTRHVSATSLAVPNQPLGVAVHGLPNDFWFLGLSFPPTGGITFPGLGTLFLDPTNMLVFSFGQLGASGREDVSVVIPGNGAGFTYSWQALVGIPLRFTNGIDTPIAQ